MEGDTSTIEAAHQLGKLCEGRQLVVNLIPYNKTDVKDKLSCPSEEHMQEFRRIVSSYGSFCSIRQVAFFVNIFTACKPILNTLPSDFLLARRTMGADIASACGQLVVEQEKQIRNINIGDIEDGPFFSSRSKKTNHTRKPNNADRKQHSKDAERITRGLIFMSGIATACFLISASLFISKRVRK